MRRSPKSRPHRVNGFVLQPLTELLVSLDATPDGLSEAEAERRLKINGPNVLRNHGRRPVILAFLSRFQNPLVLLLIAAGAISAFTREDASFAIICVVVLASVTLDFIQEYRADSAAEQLRDSITAKVMAQRGGKSLELPVSEVVPGDVVLLAAGDLVPADGRLLEAKDFFVSQSLLTGESYPVEKTPGPMPLSEDPEGAMNAVFKGSSVISGTARILACRTGLRTALGEISESLQIKPPPTAFETGTRQFGLLIMRLTLLLVLFVLFVNTYLHRPWLETFLFAMALAVGLTPELLPMVVSVTLSRGALRMAKKQVIVKRLAAIHDLGSMDVLCTDKTGTLTEARIRLERHVDVAGRASDQVLRLTYLNSFFETGLKSPLDDAILRHGEIDSAGWTKIDEVPFDFERRRVSVLIDNGRQRLLIAKGAPEDILRVCSHYLDSDGTEPQALDESARQRIDDRFASLGGEGFRVLGIAYRQVAPNHPHAVVDDESELVFVGFAAFLDPPKADAGKVLAQMRASGIDVKIVTGDNDRVTRHVCGEIGIPVAAVLTGNQIAAMNDDAFIAQVEKANLFCRVTPAQKSRILAALKKRGHVVGFLGDGINDAPALHAADVGISVDSAADVAKEAADMILLEHDLGVLHEGVVEGRRTFGNIMKYIMMGTSSNFGNMFSMAAASVFLPFLPMLPIQILLNNFLYDTSEVPIPLDRVDDDYLNRPRRWDMGFIRNFMLVVGPVSSAFDFLTFFLLLTVFQANEALFQTGWFIESLATQVLVIFVIRTRLSPLRSRPHPWLAATSLAIVLGAALLPLSPMGSYFGLVAPPPAFYGVLTVLVIAYLTLVEWIKRAFYRRFGL